MTTRKLEKREWKSYLDLVSKSLLGKAVEIEILSEEIGAQTEATLSQMFGVTYDPGDDIVEIATGRHDHIISDPARIRVEEEGLALKTIEVTQNDGVRQIIKVSEPLLLPPP